MKKILAVITTLILMLTLIGCQRELENDKLEYETTTLTHEVSKFEKMDGQSEVYTRVKVSEEFYINPEKVVTFSLGVADTLNYFGLENLSIKQFGIPKDQISLPKMLDEFNDKKYYDVGTLFEPDFSIIELINPDLIILDGRTSKFYERIKNDYPYINVLDASLTTYHIDEQEIIFNNLGEIFPNIKDELIGKIVDFKNSFSKIKEKTKEYNAMFLQLNGKLISAATSDKGRYGLLYKEFGFNFKNIPGVNLENSHGTAEISRESIKEVNPDVIFMMDRNMITEGLASDKAFLEDEVLSNVTAIKSKYIYDLNPESWYTITGGINATNQMIEDIMYFIEDIS